MSDNISSVIWSCCTYSLSYLWMFLFTYVEFLVSGAKDSSQGLHEQLCIMWSVSIDYDSHNCRQTCRSAGGAEYTQTVTLKRTYIIVWVVILVPALCFVFRSSNNLLVRHYRSTTQNNNLYRLAHKDFPCFHSTSR